MLLHYSRLSQTTKKQTQKRGTKKRGRGEKTTYRGIGRAAAVHVVVQLAEVVVQVLVVRLVVVQIGLQLVQILPGDDLLVDVGRLQLSKKGKGERAIQYGRTD